MSTCGSDWAQDVFPEGHIPDASGTDFPVGSSYVKAISGCTNASNEKR
jgi:hypothetical protein